MKKVLVFSDVHGNLPAFKKMLAAEKNISNYIFLGDIVNYGPWSNECIDLLFSLPNLIAILGNHDEAFIKNKFLGFSKLALKFAKKTKIASKQLKKIATLKKRAKINNYLLRHTIQGKYIYPESKIKFNNNYFIGHSHHQFKLTSGKYQLFNPGSVGQNRKYINIINYLLYYPEENRVEFKELEYDISELISKMKADQYQEECINYYLSKNHK